MRRYIRLTQRERYRWATGHQIFRGSNWVKAGQPRRERVNAGYWAHLIGFRMAYSAVEEVICEGSS
jgi:elongation factor P hydroxylase